MSKYARRTDGNQTEIVKILREMGFSVAITSSIGMGFPDIVVAYDFINILVEIKDAGGKLTKKEKDFFSKYTGSKVIAYSAKDVIDMFLVFACFIDSEYYQEIFKKMLLKI